VVDDGEPLVTVHRIQDLPSYRARVAVAVIADLLWWVAYLGAWTATASASWRLNVGLSVVALALRAGLNLLGLRSRLAVVVMTAIRVSSIVTSIAAVADGHHVLLNVALSPLLIVAIASGLMALAVRGGAPRHV
jgi:hypothetical protein